MKSLPETFARRSTSIWLPCLILLAGLATTFGFWRSFRAARQREVQEYFHYRSRNALKRVEERLHTYELVLIGTQALFKASESVTRAEFTTFVAGLDLDQRFPGIQGIGFNVQLPATEKTRYLAQVRSQGFPEYGIQPAGDRACYTPVLYLEPANTRNQRAFGYDTYADPVRRAAMDQARDAGRLSLSGKVKLIQETDQDVQAGFLGFLPVYRNGSAQGTLEERRQNLIGWVSAPFRMNDLMTGVFGEGGQDLDLEIYDGAEIRAETLMFDRDPAMPMPTDSTLVAHQTLTFGGHSWTLVTHPLPGMFARYGHDHARLVWVLGGMVSLLLGLLALAITTQFERKQRLSETLEQRVAERTEDLRESEEKFRTVADHTYDWEKWDAPDGTIIYCSPSCERITGYPPEAFKTDPDLLERLIHPEDRATWKAHFAAAHDDDRVQNTSSVEAEEVDVRLVRPDGEVRWIGHVCHPIYDKAGTFKGHRISNRDLTDRVRLEAQLHQSQKMESLGLLAGGVAHDINNVLAAILGLASIHLETQPPGSPVHRAFTTITKACTRGADLIQRLLGFARQGLSEEMNLDFNALVREEVRLLERTTLAKVRLHMDLATDLRPIRGDAGALSHVLMNLCVNAVDAMPENGTLTLRTRNVDAAWVEVAVEDTGCGMSQAVLEKARDPFFTTKEQGKGTGLGLSIVHSTIKAHHGHMEIISEPGQGTRVLLRFPACEIQPQASEPRPEGNPSQGPSGLRVLLVDDDELIQSSMGEILAMLGHIVTNADSGEAALMKLEAGYRPDVVLLDMNMPGLGGAGTLPRLRVLCPAVPVLLCTGRADQSALDLVETYPLVTLMPKPFGTKDLQDRFAALGLG